MSNRYLPSNITHDARWLYPLVSRIPLSGETFEAVLLKLGVVPSKSTWQQWLILLLLGLGSGLFLTGIVFFFAYNWEAMHRFSRFTLLGAGVIISSLVAFWQGTKTLLGQLALTVASMLTGVLLATFGMVYQTGADSYLFFSSWAIAILPWVIVSRFQPLWLIALMVANIAIITWGGATISQFDLFRDDTRQVTLALLTLNGCVLVLREMTSLIHISSELGRWFPRIIVLNITALVSFDIVRFIVTESYLDAPSLILLYVATLVVLSGYYLLVRKDLWVIALVMGSLILTSTTGLIEGMESSRLSLILFVTGVYIAGVTAFAAQCLRVLSKRWNVKDNVQ